MLDADQKLKLEAEFALLAEIEELGKAAPVHRVCKPLHLSSSLSLFDVVFEDSHFIPHQRRALQSMLQKQAVRLDHSSVRAGPPCSSPETSADSYGY